MPRSPTSLSPNDIASNRDMFNGQRLSVARRRRAMTKVSLAAEIDANAGAITKYEGGQQIPQEATIGKLKAALSFPRSFFFGDDLTEPPLQGTNFRALSTMSARERERSIAAGSIALMLSNWIDNRYECPAPALPDLSGLSGEQAASVLRDLWNLGDEPINHTLGLAEQAGIRIFSLPSDCVKADAFSFWLDDRPFLFIDTLKSAERRRWDVVHELGHLVLHTLDAPPSREREREADDFASHLLMPRSSVLAHAPRHATVRTLLRAKQIWGVSFMALVRRLHDLDMISDWEKQMLFVRASKQGWRTAEPNEMPAERSIVLANVLGLLAKSDITTSELATELSLHPKDVRQFLFEFEPVVIPGGKVAYS